MRYEALRILVLRAFYILFTIRNQMKEIDEYKAEFDKQLDEFKTMEEKEVNRWCFYDMKKRGAIE